MNDALKEQIDAIPDSEFSSKAITGPGNGGQKVNRTKSSAQVRFDFLESDFLDENQKETLLQTLSKNYLSSDGDIQVKVTRERSRAKEIGIQRIRDILYELLDEPTPREGGNEEKHNKIRKRIKAAKKKQKKKNKQHSDKKKNRQKPQRDD